MLLPNWDDVSKFHFTVFFLLLSVDKISDFDERDDEENFLAKLEKFKQDRRKAMKEFRSECNI